jgi:pyrroline-5-carboxylate reductase
MGSSLPSLCVLGAGHMGGAIARGLQQSGLDVDRIRVTTASRSSAKALEDSGVRAMSLEENPDANVWALEGAQIVVLGVKPPYILNLLSSVAPVAEPTAVMVSIAAGVTIHQMEAVWPGALVRTMPNTPTEVGKGVTGVAYGSRVSETQRDQTHTLFGTVGDVVVVPEESINALSAVSGSGPAFVYFFIERFIDVAKSHGFSHDQANLMVIQTFAGAMDLLEHSGATPEQLRTAVTSPGGSTAAALAVFERADLAAIIREATDHAIRRAGELAGS